MNLQEQTIKGIFWTTFARGGVLISQFITTAVLARVLKPSDFGLVAMALVFTEISNLFGNIGLGSALIQKPDIDMKHYSSAFWLNIFVGAILMFVMILFAPVIALFYGRPELDGICKVIALNFVFLSFVYVQQAILTRDMSFKQLAKRDIIAAVCSGGMGIILALLGFGAWSLVYQTLSFTVVNAMLLWFFSPWRPTIYFSVSCLKEILPFSVTLTGSGILQYLINNIDKLMIGKFLGAQALGFYSLANKVMMYPLYHVSWIVYKVMFPAFSKIQADSAKIKAVYLKMIRGVSFVTFPLTVFFLVMADDFVKVAYGPNWAPVALLIRIMCFVGMIYSITSITVPIYLALNKSLLKFKIDLINTILSGLVIWLGLRYGLTKLVLIYSLYSLVWAHISLFIASRIMTLGFVRLYRALMTAYFMSSLTIIFMVGLKLMLSCASIWRLLIVVISGIVLYITLLIYRRYLRFNNGIPSLILDS